jgi:hypothetical protein
MAHAQAQAFGRRYSVLDAREISPLAPNFVPSNQMHSINGWQWCNGPRLNVSVGARLRFVVLGTGEWWLAVPRGARRRGRC